MQLGTRKEVVAGAGRLAQHLSELWAKSDFSERRRLLLAVRDAVYVDTRDANSPTPIRPKAVFEPLFEGALAYSGFQ